MNNSVFRQKNLDKISSPEQLNDYIKVAKPSAFISLIAIIILLLGVCIWGVFGTLDTTVSFVAVVEDGNMTIYIDEDILTVSDVLTVEETKITIDQVYQTPVSAEKLDSYVLYVLAASSDSFLYYCTASTSLADGIYSSEIVTESINPIYFIIN